MTNALNADFLRRAVMQTGAMDWQPSPSPTVWRKRLDLIGTPEQGRVTSIVRYDSGSRFPSHDHPAGEEILVLDGVFSDEHGHYAAGTYLLNPQGFRHAPYSEQGCRLFVKLCQYAGAGRKHVLRDTAAMPWSSGSVSGISHKELFDGATIGDGTTECVRLVRFAPGARTPDHDHPLGEEIFVVEGMIEDQFGLYETGTWVRYPARSRHAAYSAEGCVLYVKSGHLPA